MYLKRLELSGFKSFARKSVLEFTSPVTAIVGPNGSGKSNIAEAMRFVLGEQSIKSMRGKRGEDLIFNGSPSVPKLNRATVSIVFDNTSRIFPLDYDEVEIKRVVHRDGINQYLINGSQVRLKDIIELLSALHIGASSHHIISQGEADRILNASIKERRGMIEDALGLKIYQYKRIESTRKLDKTRENLRNVEALRLEIAPHIRFLEKQVEKIKQAEKMKEELRRLYREYFKREEFYISYTREAQLHEKTPLVSELRTVEVSIAESEALVARGKEESKQHAGIAVFERKLAEFRQKKDELSRKLGRIEGMLEFEERRIKSEQAKAEEEGLPIERPAIEGLVRTFDLHLEHADKLSDVADIKLQIKEMRQALNSFGEIYLKKVEIATTTLETDELKRIITEKNSIESEISAIKSEEHTTYTQFKQLRESIASEAGNEREAERALYELRAMRSELLGRIELIKVKEEHLSEIEDRFKKELTEAGVLVGREALAYTDLAINIESILAEDRHVQESRLKTLEKIKIRIEDSGIGGSETIREYEEVVERDAFLKREIEDLHKTAESLSTLIDELGEKIDTEFKVGIKKINVQFQEFFALMFGGGTARLDLVLPPKRKSGDTDDLAEAIAADDDVEAVEEGIEITINLPRKKIRSLQVLSGGERALTSVALLFAISQVNPPPFLVLDETDAALDESNSRKYGDMMASLANYSQLIIITHNRETMHKAGTLYGVTAATDGVSKLLSIHFDTAAQMAH